MNTNVYIDKLLRIINHNIKKEKYESALVASKVLASIYYEYNQIYTDTVLEDLLLKVRDAVLVKNAYQKDNQCVFFYDGFGMDLRGLAVVYARALVSLGYKIVYACPDTSRNKIPHIISELSLGKTTIVYIKKKSAFIERIKAIDDIFKKYKPGSAFFYTTPWDVEAAIAFSNNKTTVRFQLDLTDHAFWIGRNAFDYIINGREIGASNSVYKRGISEKRIIKLDCAPYINKDVCKEKLPFDIRTEKYIFTGGALYKTLGDAQLLYYQTIDYILTNFKDIKFLYAGSGDDSEIHKLILKYPQRVYLIAERPDFYDIICNCQLYINSYPMFGGLMMRYAALAGKVPITLRHDNDADGILVNQEKLGIEFDSYNEYIEEIYLLLSDDSYRNSKEKNLTGSVMTEEDFQRNLDLLINEHRTESMFDSIRRFDTTEFRKEYKQRYKKKSLVKTVFQKGDLNLLKYFPVEFMYGFLITVKERLF